MNRKCRICWRPLVAHSRCDLMRCEVELDRRETLARLEAAAATERYRSELRLETE